MPTPWHERSPAAEPLRSTVPVGYGRDALLIIGGLTVAVGSLLGPLPPLGVLWCLVVIAALAFAVLPPSRAFAQAMFVVVTGAAISTVAVLVRGATPAAALGNWLAFTLSAVAVGLALRWRCGSLERRTRVAEALARLGQRALSVTEPDELLAGALAMAVDVLRADFGTAARLLSDGRLVVAAELGPGSRAAGTTVQSAAVGALATTVLESGRPMASPDLRTDARLRPSRSLLDRGVVSGVAVPLTGDDGTVGILALYCRRPRRFTADEVSVVQAMASIAVTAWDQANHRERLSHQALHDPLTGLPNRALLLDRLEHALARRPGTRAGAPSAAVALIDLDQFKSVNDGLGHAAGDAVLREIGLRLASAVRAEDTVARLGGDEFALLCTGVPDEQIAVALARRLLQACAQPLEVDGAVLTVTASAGITMSTTAPPVATAETLLREADIALYRAKDRGGGRVELFNRRMQIQAQARLQMENQLRSAIDRDELVVHYLPIRAAGDQRVLGVEALVRWRHPERGMLEPAEFLPLAEHTGVIVPLGLWVLRTACAQVARWQRSSAAELRVAVNISLRQLEDPDLLTRVCDAIEAGGLTPGTLTLELTEAALLTAGDTARAASTGLAAAGVALSLDEFGTGYSSLSQLTVLPLDALKIDRSFIAGLDREPAATAVISAAIALGADLGVTVVAEGVESARQLARLRQLGCPAVQGFLLDTPGPEPRWRAPVLP